MPKFHYSDQVLSRKKLGDQRSATFCFQNVVSDLVVDYVADQVGIWP